jgi:hypothetical protein
LQRVLAIIFHNNGLFQELENVDFAKQLYTKNLEYSSCIKEAQFNYNPFGTKILRVLTIHSNLQTYNSIAEDLKQIFNNKKKLGKILAKDIREDLDHKDDIDIACIELELSMPAYLQMLNITDSIDTAKTMANSIAEAYGLAGGNTIDEATASSFKLKLIKKFIKNIDWTFIDDSYSEAIAESKPIAAEKVKTNTIDEHIQNPQDSQTNIADEVPEDASEEGGGGEESMGEGGGEEAMGEGEGSAGGGEGLDLEDF